MSIEGQGHFFTIYFPGFVCFVLYKATISGERLQDHWSSGFYMSDMSLVMRKPAFCICENKDADQLRGNPEADQHLCFRNIASTIPLLPKYIISSLKPSSVTAQPSLCRSRSETPYTGFLTTRHICFQLLHESEKAKDPVHKLRKEGEKVYTILGEIIGKVSLQLNLFKVTIHLGDMEIAFDRWLLLAA